MSGYQKNVNKEEVPNKVKFSSVKLGATKQGSNTVGLYLKRDQMEKMHTLLTELLQANEDGCKIGVIVIEGKSYDSGYAYVNPKEKREGSEQGAANEGQANGKASYPKGNKPSFGKDSARSFFKNKRVE